MKQKGEIRAVFVRHLDETEPSSDPSPKTEKLQSSTGATGPAAAIVGDKSSKLYYMPDMKEAGRVKKVNRAFFSSEEEAIEHGFTKAVIRSGKRPKKKLEKN